MADRLTPEQLLERLSFSDVAGIDRQALTRRARETFSSRSFIEYWKYTPVRDFLGAMQSTASRTPTFGGLDQAGIRRSSLREGQFQFPVDGAGSDSSERFPLADLALLMTGDLLRIDINESPRDPVRLTTADGIAVPVLISVAPGVELSLIEQSESHSFCNQVLYLILGEGASVEHASTALGGSGSHWSMTQVRQEAGSRYARQQYQMGASRRRTETQVLLCGRGASAEITGAYLVEDATHLDQQLVVEHRAPDTRSRQKFHGIGAGKGVAVFNGRIHIHPGSPGSDAELSNRNLALHPEAVINTKPELEIYTDDVKCAHGATIGRISEDSLFYLLSRGLGPVAAKRMLCRAFIGECIEGPLADRAEAALLASLAAAPVLLG